MGRTAVGVKGIGMKGEDEIVGMITIRREATVLTVTEEALAKRTPVAEFPLQKRGGMGNRAMPAGGGGKVVAALEVLEADEVMLISAGGKVTRVAADAVPLQGRRTQGRKMVKLAPGDRVVEVTRTQGGGAEPVPAMDGPERQLDLLGE